MSKIVILDEYRPHISLHVECKECGYGWFAVYPEKTTALECPNCGEYVNEYGTKVFVETCKSCKRQFSICPPPKKEHEKDWEYCLSEDCESYDPDRDASKYFTDE